MSDLPVAGLRNSLRFQAALPARIRHRPVMHAGRLAPLLRTPRDWSMKTSAFLLLSFLLFALSGCASLGRDYEEPTVVVTAFRSIPTEGMAPAFEVGLRIINPNPTDLVLDGIVYTISLEDTEVIKGVGRDFPVIEAYTQEDVTITASVQLLAGLRLFARLVSSKPEAIRYAFEAKLDLAGFYPSVYVSEEGQLDLAPAVR
jgi:LEA14-like dessication related protein